MIFSPVSREATAKGIAEQMAEQHRVSTDPKWPPEEMNPQNGPAGIAKPDGQAAPRLDGRTRKGAESRRAILAACRELMIGGVWRPTMEEACELARRAVRTGFQWFTSVEVLHLEALQDGVVREAILDHACGPLGLPEHTKWRILKAIVTGKAG